MGKEPQRLGGKFSQTSQIVIKTSGGSGAQENEKVKAVTRAWGLQVSIHMLRKVGSWGNSEEGDNFSQSSQFREAGSGSSRLTEEDFNPPPGLRILEMGK